MEKKADNSKIIKILIPVAVLVAVAIIAALFLRKEEEGYRLIQVYEINGQASIERETIGSMDAYENLNLLSGDKVTTMQESSMRLKLDKDKYLFAEADTILELVATGDEKSNRTNINLLQGAVTIEVENKLNEDSSFEVTTPNSVMAIRGTVFRVTLGMDENGEPVTKVMIFEGAVGVQKMDKEGNLTEETLISESKEAIIYQENEEEVLVILDEIELTELPVEVLEFLKEIIEGGRELSISLEDIETAIEEANVPENVPENTPENTPENVPEETPENVTEGTPEKAVYTVTFTYNGSVFGTQRVTEGECATKPTLMPAPSGKWDYDFSKPITGNTEIKFVE